MALMSESKSVAGLPCPAFTPHNFSHTNMHNFNVMGFCCYVPGTADEPASLSMSI